jgi:hypothetical protein
LSLRTAEIVRKIADRLTSNRDGFFVHKYAPSVPNDQVTRYHPIQVILASCHIYRPPLSRGCLTSCTVQTGINSPTDSSCERLGQQLLGVAQRPHGDRKLGRVLR